MEKVRTLEEAILFAKDKDVIIGGIVMNVGNFLPKVRENINRVVTLFKSYKILIFENDSTDNTLEYLLQWSKEDKNLSVISQVNLKGTIEGRTHCTCYCRNTIVNAIEMHPQYKDRDYYICIDMDDVFSHNFELNNVLTSFQYDDWAGMGACHSQGYYDIWALRDKNITYNCWDMIRHEMYNGMSSSEATGKHVQKYKYIFKDDDPLYEVDSCFGGMMIYDIKKIKGCRENSDYICDIDLPNKGPCIYEDCDHITFHKEIRDKGGRLFINPAMKIM